MVPYSPRNAHGGHEPALLAAAVDDGHEVDVVRNDITAAPPGHVKVLVQNGLADVLVKQTR